MYLCIYCSLLVGSYSVSETVKCMKCYIYEMLAMKLIHIDTVTVKSNLLNVNLLNL